MHVTDTINHVVLIWLYKTGLLKWAVLRFDSKYYTEYANTELKLNDRQHQIVVELTRYINVYGVKAATTIILNVLIVILLSILVSIRQLSVAVIAIVASIFLNDIVTLISVYLSFRWGEATYEKMCCYHKNTVKAYVTKKVLTESLQHYNSRRLILKSEMAHPLLLG